MEINRYVLIQAVKTDDNEIIPIWDERVSFVKDKDYGNLVKIVGYHNHFYNLTECVYDLQTKSVQKGIEIDQYPNITDFKKGEIIFYEVNGSYKHIKEAVIVDILFEEYDMTIVKGKKLQDIKDVQPDSLYCVKEWKPFYLLDDGKKIKYDYQLYHKHINNNEKTN
jgi:hypothetical protein